MTVEAERLPPIDSNQKLTACNDAEHTTGGIYAGKFIDRSPFLQSVSNYYNYKLQDKY